MIRARCWWTWGWICACAVLGACSGDDDDAPTDAGVDGQTAMADAGSDGSTPAECLNIGEPCDGTRCESGSGRCVEAETITLGGAEDPISGLPGGGNSIDIPLFEGGYCSPAWPNSGNRAPCNPGDPDESVCGPCGRCVVFGGLPGCMASCQVSIDDAGGCREGYQCDLIDEVCQPGCATDDDCRVSREDTNSNGMVSAADGDQLVYDTRSAAVCSPETRRCEFPGRADAETGDRCTRNEDCEANGFCIPEGADGDGSWPGGHCSKARCDLAGNECAGAGAVCASRGFPFDLCLQGCTVAEGASDSDAAAWLTNRGGCAETLRCLWNGQDGVAAGNGFCESGNFNAVTTPNLGVPCTQDDDCWSPFGVGRCIPETAQRTDGATVETGWNEGYCVVDDCAAPGMPTTLCGDDAVCASFDPESICLARCSSADDCRPGYGCVQVPSLATTPEMACFPACFQDQDCRTGETCQDLQPNPGGGQMGVCRPAT